MALEQTNFYRNQHGSVLLTQDLTLRKMSESDSKKQSKLFIDDVVLAKLNLGMSFFQKNSTEPFDIDPFDCEGFFYQIYNFWVISKIKYIFKKSVCKWSNKLLVRWNKVI